MIAGHAGIKVVLGEGIRLNWSEGSRRNGMGWASLVLRLFVGETD